MQKGLFTGLLAKFPWRTPPAHNRSLQATYGPHTKNGKTWQESQAAVNKDRGWKTEQMNVKFTPGQNPLDNEEYVPTINAPPHWKKQQAAHLLTARVQDEIHKAQHAPSAEAAQQHMAHATALIAEMEKSQHANLTGRKQDEDFAARFVLWLRGQGDRDELTKTPWGNTPLMFPDVIAYQERLYTTKVDYQMKLQLLKTFGPHDLNSAYLYYKYIIHGAEPIGMEFMSDFDKFYDNGHETSRPDDTAVTVASHVADHDGTGRPTRAAYRLNPNPGDRIARERAQGVLMAEHQRRYRWNKDGHVSRVAGARQPITALEYKAMGNPALPAQHYRHTSMPGEYVRHLLEAEIDHDDDDDHGNDDDDYNPSQSDYGSDDGDDSYPNFDESGGDSAQFADEDEPGMLARDDGIHRDFADGHFQLDDADKFVAEHPVDHDDADGIIADRIGAEDLPSPRDAPAPADVPDHNATVLPQAVAVQTKPQAGPAQEPIVHKPGTVAVTAEPLPASGVRVDPSAPPTSRGSGPQAPLPVRQPWTPAPAPSAPSSVRSGLLLTPAAQAREAEIALATAGMPRPSAPPVSPPAWVPTAGMPRPSAPPVSPPAPAARTREAQIAEAMAVPSQPQPASPPAAAQPPQQVQARPQGAVAQADAQVPQPAAPAYGFVIDERSYDDIGRDEEAERAWQPGILPYVPPEYVNREMHPMQRARVDRDTELLIKTTEEHMQNPNPGDPHGPERIRTLVRHNRDAYQALAQQRYIVQNPSGIHDFEAITEWLRTENTGLDIPETKTTRFRDASLQVRRYRAKQALSAMHNAGIFVPANAPVRKWATGLHPDEQSLFAEFRAARTEENAAAEAAQAAGDAEPANVPAPEEDSPENRRRRRVKNTREAHALLTNTQVHTRRHEHSVAVERQRNATAAMFQKWRQQHTAPPARE